MDEIKISRIQFFVIVSLFMSGGSMLILPSVAAQEAGPDAWMSIIVSIVFGLAVIPLFINLSSKFPNQTIVQYSQIILGKLAGKIVSVIFLITVFMLSAALLWDVSILANVQIMPETPMLAIEILIMFVVVMGARLGLETVTRTGEILFPWAAILFVVPVLFLFPEMKWDNMLPIFNEGIKPILRSSYSVTAIMFVESYVLLMVIPYVSEKKALLNVFMISALLAGLVLLVTVVYCVAVLGAESTGNLSFPTYSLAKRISIGNFLERVEAVIAGVWVITIYFKATVCFFVTLLGTAQLFNLKDYRPLTVPFGLILLPLASTIFPNMVYFRLVSAKYFSLIDYMVGLMIPLLLWIVYQFRKKTLQNKAQNKPQNKPKNKRMPAQQQ